VLFAGCLAGLLISIASAIEATNQNLVLTSRLFFAPQHAMASLYFVSRPKTPHVPLLEKLTYSFIPLSMLCYTLENFIKGIWSNGFANLTICLFYFPIYKILRRLRKRIYNFSPKRKRQYVSQVVFGGLSGMVPIFYFCSESLGCVVSERSEVK